MVRKSIFILVPLGILTALFFLFIKPGKPAAENEKAMIDAGRYFFFDTRLSYNNSKSCGSCHDPKFAFTDGYRRSITASGEELKHNAPSLVNIAAQHYFDWANPTIKTLEKQHERPLFSISPVELGAKVNEELILKRLETDSFYQQKLSETFPGLKEPIQFKTIIKSIAAFVRSIKSYNSPYDKFLSGNKAALDSSAQAGMKLFFSERLNCSSCHAGINFTTASLTKNTDSIYFNTGLYNVLNKNKYPVDDNGLAAVTKNPKDDGKFKTPSLRNVALTAPYTHDGSVNTLEDIINLYTNGGRNYISGSSWGNGQINKLRDKRIRGFSITPEEKKQLINFLFSLTDSAVLTNPAFQNPFNLNNK